MERQTDADDFDAAAGQHVEGAVQVLHLGEAHLGVLVVLGDGQRRAQDVGSRGPPGVQSIGGVAAYFNSWNMSRSTPDEHEQASLEVGRHEWF